ncbi:putative ATP-dependent endonuclease of the OLD family [Bacillus sp. 5mfcol3.1]|uniref:ATP-dependent nuclease n=1 Tax=Bacillus sp. 5mfcol3.1 TaxID=1761756 RepID=UPI0008E8AA73|nr:AAA family ATPase [Bacillus sp. 5mfcol3.1]SFM21629.1 putative ATP-dependent endonuclease of the OLD family [Bacillus sp. 5mfcol3.1]
MYLSEVYIKNFRKFGNQGLHLTLNKGFNLFVGENDSGKTTIIDAIKLVLGTQSNDFSRIEIDDFHIASENSPENERAKTLEISCIIRDISLDEAKHLLEWLSFEKVDGKTVYVLHISYFAKREGKKVFYDVKAGIGDGGRLLNSEARNRIRATYLKPLRDANTELAPRKNSRLSNILNSHAAFENEDSHFLLETFKEANKKIDSYFKGKDINEGDLPDQLGKNLLEEINTYLNKFSNKNKVLESSFRISDLKLRNILERLTLEFESSKPGLGSHNILFIAAELLLLKREEFDGLKLALIEEIEAHLHTQAQIRLIEYLQEEAESSDIQLILSTHSTALSSKIKLENLFICNNNNIFSMRSDETELLKGDYLFLERFLDATKADMFFAQGVIMVEGDAENLILPSLSKVIGKPFSQYGVTVLNVGSTAFLRYSSIFKRKNRENGLFNIPVACVTDLDIDTNEYISDEGLSEAYKEKRQEKQASIVKRYDGQLVRTFVSPYWTLEHDIALSELRPLLLKAILQAKKIQNSDKYGLTDEKNAGIEEEIKIINASWKKKNYNNFQIAHDIYKNLITPKNNKISKAIIAQCFANLIEEYADKEELKQNILRDEKLRYLVEAITHVTSEGGTEND